MSVAAATTPRRSAAVVLLLLRQPARGRGHPAPTRPTSMPSARSACARSPAPSCSASRGFPRRRRRRARRQRARREHRAAGRGGARRPRRGGGRDAAHALVRAEIIRPEPLLAFGPSARPRRGSPRSCRRAAAVSRARARRHVAAAPPARRPSRSPRSSSPPSRGAAWGWSSCWRRRPGPPWASAAESATTYSRRALEEPPRPNATRTSYRARLRACGVVRERPIRRRAAARRLRRRRGARGARAARGAAFARAPMFIGEPEEAADGAAAAALPPELLDLDRWAQGARAATVVGHRAGRAARALAGHRALPADAGLGSNGLAALAALGWAYTVRGAADCAEPRRRGALRAPT